MSLIDLDKLKIKAKQYGSTGSDKLLYGQVKESKYHVKLVQIIKATADSK